MAALLPAACLAPPDGTGDLSARLLWPGAFTRTGGGMADVVAAIKVYLTEGYARTAGVGVSEALKNESARQWVRYRSLSQAYERALLSPSSVSTDDGFSVSMLLTQIQDIKALADAALAASNLLLIPVVEMDYTPRTVQSGSSEMIQRW